MMTDTLGHVAAKGPAGSVYRYGGLTLAMSTGSPLREASSMGSSPLAWRRCILAPSTSFFCLARSAACRSCFLRPSRKASCCWALVVVPLEAALPAGAGPDGGALEGEAFSWAVEAAGVFCC